MEKAKEGSLYRVVELGGRSFELRYGYYADYERESAYGEPIPIYPDLESVPVYTREGERIVTQMQALCEHGDSSFPDGFCSDCSHFQPKEELFGICGCKANRASPQSVSTEDTV